MEEKEQKNEPKATISKKQKEEEIAKKIFKSIQVKAETITKEQPENPEIKKLLDEIKSLKEENFNVKTLAALERSGCLKPELVLKTVPKDCENIEEWIEGFKTENDILFGQTNLSHGGNFKPINCKNLSPNEIMNNFIRGI